MPTLSFLTRLASLETKVAESQEAKLPTKVKYHYQDPHIVERLSYGFFQHLKYFNPDFSRPLIIVAIGTDRSTGDSLGPLVGTRLTSHTGGYHIFGTLDEPVHASNLSNKLREIKDGFKKPLIVAVDASLGHSDSVGSITLQAGPLKPGTGVNKNLQEVGELHFTGIVNVGGYMEYFVLQNTRLSLVWKLSELISESIKKGYYLAQTSLLNRLPQTLQ